MGFARVETTTFSNGLELLPGTAVAALSQSRAGFAATQRPADPTMSPGAGTPVPKTRSRMVRGGRGGRGRAVACPRDEPSRAGSSLEAGGLAQITRAHSLKPCDPHRPHTEDQAPAARHTWLSSWHTGARHVRFSSLTAPTPHAHQCCTTCAGLACARVCVRGLVVRGRTGGIGGGGGGLSPCTNHRGDSVVQASQAELYTQPSFWNPTSC